jgi:hypothetical protein
MQQARPSSWTYLGLKIQGDLGPFTCYTSKRGKVVWYLKAPPKEPPTWEQVLQQNLFQCVGWAWQALAPPQREQWERVTKRARLRITGYDLFTYLETSGDEAALATIERQAGEQIDRMA